VRLLNHADVVGAVTDAEANGVLASLHHADDESLLKRRRSAAYNGLCVFC
jgi:hypothetical protein